MWAGPPWQRQFGFDIPAGSTRIIQATYAFTHVTPEAALRVRLGPAVRSEGGPPRLLEIAVERVYGVGAGNPAAAAFRSSFRELQTGHLDLFAIGGSLAASRLAGIAAERERAVAQIGEILAVKPSQRIRLVFYPDAGTKTAHTGHQGAGLARGNTLVEIYSHDTQLDPYHELAHILARQLGDPPALMNEGFATWVSERLGSDALRHLGHPGERINQVVRELALSGQLIPLRDLIRYTEIGSEASRPAVAYPQAASVVGFLIDTHGLPRFRQAFAALGSGDEPDRARRNEDGWLAVFGQSIEQSEAGWRQNVTRQPAPE